MPNLPQKSKSSGSSVPALLAVRSWSEGLKKSQTQQLMSKKEENSPTHGLRVLGEGQRGMKATYKCLQDSASVRKDCLGGARSRVGTGPGKEKMPGKHS